MSATMESCSVAVGRRVGLKLEISPEIRPRDMSIGMKIFTLVPSTATTVREVKNYIGNFVLKTPVPFHIYMGEYRICEEEDAQIFSVISEPCRLMPVPVPRSALSSTPKIKQASALSTVHFDVGTGSNSSSSSSVGKKVTFFDGDISASPVRRPGENGIDMIDYQSSTIQPAVHTPDQFIIPSPNPNVDTDNGRVDEVDDNSSDRKKRRRRRHRSRKSKSEGQTTEFEVEDVESDVAVAMNVNENGSSGSTAQQNTNDRSSTSKRKSSSRSDGDNDGKVSSNSVHVKKNGEVLGILNEETESEDETSAGSVSVNNPIPNPNEPAVAFTEFATPQMISKTTSHRPKRPKLSDSAFGSSDSFISPLSNSENSKFSNKVRQDTPVVPRVIKNPRIFDNARKILNVFASNEEEPNCLEQEENEKEKSEKNKVEKASKSKKHASVSGLAAGKSDGISETLIGLAEKGEEFYQSLKTISTFAEVKMGDVIAFKILELDERYNPSLSAFKEAVVTEKAESQLTIKYSSNYAIVRTGKYEFPGDSFDLKTEDDEDIATIDFADMVEPKFVDSHDASVANPDLRENLGPNPVATV